MTSTQYSALHAKPMSSAPGAPTPPDGAAVVHALQLAHTLVAQGQPHQALKVVIKNSSNHPTAAAPPPPRFLWSRRPAPSPVSSPPSLVQVVAEVLRARGLEREANESVARCESSFCEGRKQPGRAPGTQPARIDLLSKLGSAPQTAALRPPALSSAAGCSRRWQLAVPACRQPMIWQGFCR